MKNKKKFVAIFFIFIMLILFLLQRELLKNILGLSLILSPFVIIIWALTHKWKDNHTQVKSHDCVFDDENMDNSYDIQRKVSHIEKRTTTTNTNTTVTTETIYFKGE